MIIDSPAAPAAIGPYGKRMKIDTHIFLNLKTLKFSSKAQAIKVNGMVYTSGSLPVIPETGNVKR